MPRWINGQYVEDDGTVRLDPSQAIPLDGGVADPTQMQADFGDARARMQRNEMNRTLQEQARALQPGQTIGGIEVGGLPPRQAAARVMEGMQSQAMEQPGQAPMQPMMPQFVQAPDQVSTSSTTQRSRTIVSDEEKEAQKRLQNTYDLQSQAIDAQRDVEIQKARAAEEVAAERERIALETEQRRATIQQEANTEIEAKRADLQAKREAVQDFEFKDYWADKSTGTRIGAAIAMALGQYASGMLGGPNGAAQIIQDSMDRDMALQRARLDKLMQSEKYAQLDVSEALALKQEALSDLTATQMAAMDRVQMMADKRAAQIGTPAAQASAQQIKAQLATQQAQVYQTWLADTTRQAETRATTRNRQSGGMVQVGGGVAGLPPGMDPKDVREIRDTDGSVIGYSHKEDAEKLRGTVEEVAVMHRLADQMREIGASGSIPFSDAKRKLESLKSQMVTTYKNVVGLGVLSGEDIKIVENAIDMGITGNTARLDSLMHNLEEKKQDALKSRLIRMPQQQQQASPAQGMPQSQAMERPQPSRAELAKLKRELQRNPNGPRADRIRAVLSQAGF